MAEIGQTSLSERERQLLSFAASGLTDTAIANRLGISETTVKTYWRRIRTKVGRFSRTEIVATVLRTELECAVNAILEDSRKHIGRDAALGKFYKRLIDQAPDAILLVSPDGVIKMLNEAAATLFGWSRDELRGRHISALIPDRYRSAHLAHVEQYIESPKKGPMRDHLATHGLHRSGEEITVDAALAPLSDGDEEFVICVVRDMQNRLFGHPSATVHDPE